MAVALMPEEIGDSGVLLVRAVDGVLHVRRTERMASLPVHLAVSPDGARVLSVDSEDRVVLSDGISGATLSAVDHEAHILEVSFSPKGAWAIALAENGEVSIIDTATAKRSVISLDTSLTGGVTGVAIVNEEPWILVSGVAGKALIYDVEGRVLLELSGGSEPMIGIALSPDARTAITFGYEDLIWDLSPTAALYTFWAHDGSTEAVRFCPEDRSLMTGGADGAVRLWDLTGATTPTQLATHDDWVTWVECIGRANRRALSAGLDGTMYVVDGERRWNFDLHHAVTSSDDTARWIWDASVSGDGRRAATVGQDGVLVITRTDSPRIERRWTVGDRPLTSVAISANGELVAVGDEVGVVHLYSPGTEEARKLFTQGYSIVQLAFSSDERFLLSVSADGTAQIFDLIAERLAYEVRHDDALTTGDFSPDDVHFVTGGLDRAARVWDTGTGELIYSFDTHLDGVTATQFAGPDRLITGSIDGRVRVWDLNSGDLLALLEFGEEVRAIDIASDYRLVAVALADGRVVVWPCVICGDIEDATLLGYQLVAPLAAQGRQ
jgi:WD40 repeat protein